ncbi:MAG: ABC transporter permease [Anaerolineales bacterium]
MQLVYHGIFHDRLAAVTRAAFAILRIAALLVLVIPILALLARGIDGQATTPLDRAGLGQAVLVSLITTSLATLAAFILGTPLALFLAETKFRFKKVASVIVELPIVLPPTVAGLALLLAAGRRGLLGDALSSVGISVPFTTAAVVIAQFFVAAPFFIRAAQSAFETIPKELLDAARIDGAAPFAVFRMISLPLASNALAAGLTICWARAMGEFGATLLFAGNLAGRTRTMTLFIYTAFESDIDAAITASTILLGLAFLALTVSRVFSARAYKENS